MCNLCCAWFKLSCLVASMAVISNAGILLETALPAKAGSRFNDVQQGYWAQRCIERLEGRGVISGYPNGSFRPDAPVTRAEFAVMIEQAFRGTVWGTLPGVAVDFVDVPSSYWAYTAIQKVSEAQYLSGYPDKSFNPEQNITRAQVLVALASGYGMNSQPTQSVAKTLTATFNDAKSIPNYAKTRVAAATEKGWVVNYPNVRLLNPNRSASRAEVAAFLCKTLPGLNALVPPQYIASPSSSQKPSTP